MLLFSNLSLEKIRKKIQYKTAYIIPGIISKDDYLLSNLLNCPLFADDFDLVKTLFSKSGSKRVFEINNIAFPISAWDIRNEEEFYETLAGLIKKYIHVNIWVFKMNDEIHGRGIAHIQLDKINSYNELKKERINDIINEETFLIDLKNILIKVINLFKLFFVYKYNEK